MSQNLRQKEGEFTQVRRSHGGNVDRVTSNRSLRSLWCLDAIFWSDIWLLEAGEWQKKQEIEVFKPDFTEKNRFLIISRLNKFQASRMYSFVCRTKRNRTVAELRKNKEQVNMGKPMKKGLELPQLPPSSKASLWQCTVPQFTRVKIYSQRSIQCLEITAELQITCS